MPQFPNKVRGIFFRKLYGFFQKKFKETDKAFVMTLVSQIEKEMFDYSELKKQKYNQLARKKWLLINDVDNEKVVESLIDGSLSVKLFVEKEANELTNNNKLEEMVKKAQELNMNSMQSDFYLKNSTYKEGEFTCFKCKGKKIITFQKQMRSADEPMTTFFNCVTCGNRWKM